MRNLSTVIVFIVAACVGGSAALAQDTASAGSKVNVFQYAMQNPVDDSQLSSPPTLGESVPRKVQLVPLGDGSSYAYFYYNGRPVIVDLDTRSVVRVGK